MSLNRLRLIVQHLSFFVLTYGGYFRISLGNSVPCLSCPFIASCSGRCYLMIYQRGLSNLFGPLVYASGGFEGWDLVWDNFKNFLVGFSLFVLLVVVLGKSWCGWVCPFGVVQDWLGRLRRLFKVRESEIGPLTKKRLSTVKYVVLAYVSFFPLMVGLGWVPREFSLAWCRICPAKVLMPLFVGDFAALSMDSGTLIMTAFSLTILGLAALTLVGSFLKDRLFCLFCPMLAFINLFQRWQLLRLVKVPRSCLGCGSCRSGCAMDNDASYREKSPKETRLYAPDCLGCFKCAASCSSEGGLNARLGPITLFSSNRKKSL